MNRFVEVSAKTNENLMKTFEEFYMEIYHRNKEKVIEKKNKNLKAYESFQKQEVNSCCQTMLFNYKNYLQAIF